MLKQANDEHRLADLIGAVVDVIPITTGKGRRPIVFYNLLVDNVKNIQLY